MEPVLRGVELAANLSNNTDLDVLLAARLDGGHLPEPDLRAPHPFRGSAPGVLFKPWPLTLWPFAGRPGHRVCVHDPAAWCVQLSQQSCTQYLPALGDQAS